MEILWEAGSDLLLLETQPSLHEALIEADIAEELGADYWISFSCRDGSHIHEGDRIADCAAALSQGHPHLRMIGVNCTPPQFVEHLIGELKGSTSLPIAVYPNSGESTIPPPRPGTAAGTASPSGTTPTGGCGQEPRPWAAAAARWTPTSGR